MELKIHEFATCPESLDSAGRTMVQFYHLLFSSLRVNTFSKPKGAEKQPSKTKLGEGKTIQKKKSGESESCKRDQRMFLAQNTRNRPA